MTGDQFHMIFTSVALDSLLGEVLGKTILSNGQKHNEHATSGNHAPVEKIKTRIWVTIRDFRTTQYQCHAVTEVSINALIICNFYETCGCSWSASGQAGTW